MSSFAPVPDQLALLERGVVDFHVRAELEQRLEESRQSGRPLRVKAGFDPTRPDLHLGHAVLLQKMRQSSRTSGTRPSSSSATSRRWSATRPARTRAARASRAKRSSRSAQTYLDQAFKVLDRDKVELRRNSEWLDALTMVDAVELMAKSTVSRMLERKDFRQRFDEQRPIHQHEFLYPLLQGYDSVALECDVELGGTDQLFNLLVGRDLMGKYGKRPQIVMTTPILEGIDARIENGVVVGKKMSKSADNYIGLQEEPLVDVPQGDADRRRRHLPLLRAPVVAHARRDRRAQAREGAAAATRGRSRRSSRARSSSASTTRRPPSEPPGEFAGVYGKDAVPDDVPSVELAPSGGVAELAWALKQANLADSTSAARRLVEQGGVEIDGQRVTDPKTRLLPGSVHLVRVGSKSRRFARIRIAPG